MDDNVIIEQLENQFGRITEPTISFDFELTDKVMPQFLYKRELQFIATKYTLNPVGFKFSKGSFFNGLPFLLASTMLTIAVVIMIVLAITTNQLVWGVVFAPLIILGIGTVGYLWFRSRNYSRGFVSNELADFCIARTRVLHQIELNKFSPYTLQLMELYQKIARASYLYSYISEYKDNLEDAATLNPGGEQQECQLVKSCSFFLETTENWARNTLRPNVESFIEYIDLRDLNRENINSVISYAVSNIQNIDKSHPNSD